jgi:glycosyltransferase involved in cell wall biosynthesis
MKKAPRTVVYVDYHPGIAGGQVVLLQHFKALDPRRYRPVLVLPSEGAFAREARALGVRVHSVAMGKASWRRPWEAWPAARALARILRHEQAALAYANCHPANKLAAVAARLAGIPAVWHKHIMGRRRFSTTGFLWRLFGRLDRLVITPSQQVLASMQAMGIPAGKLRRLYNRVDIAAVRRLRAVPLAKARRLGLPAGGPLLGVVAMHRGHKGVDLFLQACLQVASLRPKARFAVIGDPEEDRAAAQVRVLAADARLRGRLGLIPGQRDAPAWMRRFDVLVSPSRWEVGAPLVPMEAMALGVPVLGTDLGCGELITHGRDGWLAPSGDADALARGMLRLIDDPALARRLGRAGRRTVERHWGLQGYGQAVMALLDEAIDGPPEERA